MTGTLKVRVNGAWQPIGTARGDGALGVVGVGTTLGQVSVPAGAGVTKVTGTLSVYLSTGRRYRVVYMMRALAANGAVNIKLYDGGADTGYVDAWQTAPTANYAMAFIETVVNGDNVQHSYEIGCTNSNGTTVYGSPYTPFYVEDIGPNSTPAPPVPETPPAWTPLTLQNGWILEPTAGYNFAAYRKIGDIVTLRGTVQQSGTGGWSAPFTLPAGFRPPSALRVLVGAHRANVGGIYTFRCDLAPQGYLNGISFSTTP